jgi:two-component system, NtrC family, response regulator AtoC
MAATRGASINNGARQASHHIAILDADPAILEYLLHILADAFRVTLCGGVAELDQCVHGPIPPDLLLMDWNLAEDGAGGSALELLAKTHASFPLLPIVILACSAELNEVVAAARMGATAVVLKPFTRGDIDDVVQRCLRTAPHREAGDLFAETRIDEETTFVRSSRCMREIESQCSLVAGVDIPVLILGESGTGKEVAARLIHKMSARSQRSFLKVNCAAMPADLLESELFGYEQGAFTGAVKAKPGRFEICDKGTMFLDEIGEMPNALQAKLLQVLQDGSFSRLGSRSTVKVDVRVIAATNIDMRTAIVQKQFREDLYYRLNGFTLKMPPLRQRIEGIPTLAAYFMHKMAAKYEREPLPISPALMQALTGYSWPGNVRELENTIRRYLVLGDEQAIIGELLPHFKSGPSGEMQDTLSGAGGLKHLVRNLKGGAEYAAIAQALERAGWNRKAAAGDLQISYKALLYKIKQYNLRPTGN